MQQHLLLRTGPPAQTDQARVVAEFHGDLRLGPRLRGGTADPRYQGERPLSPMAAAASSAAISSTGR